MIQASGRVTSASACYACDLPSHFGHLHGAYLLGIPRPAFVLALFVLTAQECPYQVLGHRPIMAATRLHVACLGSWP
jgi:hypothetical protein